MFGFAGGVLEPYCTALVHVGCIDCVQPACTNIASSATTCRQQLLPAGAAVLLSPCLLLALLPECKHFPPRSHLA